MSQRGARTLAIGDRAAAPSVRWRQVTAFGTRAALFWLALFLAPFLAASCASTSAGRSARPDAAPASELPPALEE